jgi:hypothetical protein
VTSVTGERYTIAEGETVILQQLWFVPGPSEGGVDAPKTAMDAQKTKTPQTPVRVLGRIAEQPSPEYCSIPSLHSDFPLVNGT